MYFDCDESRGIKVPAPFSRVMIPYMMPDTVSCPIDFSVHLTQWEPGAQVDEHLHESGMEVMYCLSGSGTASVNGDVYPLTPDCMIAAAPGELHQIKNTGDVPLRVLCIFSPPMTGQGLKERAQAAVRAHEESLKGR